MDKKRIIIIDELRVIAVILMIIYHALYSMEFIFGYDLGFNLLKNRYTIILQIVIGCSFVFISGVSNGLTRNSLKNGIKVGIISILITLLTKIFIPSEIIVFGVLHFLATMMIIMGIWKLLKERKERKKAHSIVKLNPKNIGEIFAILFVACYNISELYRFKNGNILTSILGFPAEGFYSADYYPLIPWTFLFLSGYYLKGIFESERIRSTSILGENGILVLLGRNSLKLYVVHQPIIILLLFIIEKLFR